MEYLDERILHLKHQAQRNSQASVSSPTLSQEQVTLSIAAGSVELFQGTMEFEPLVLAEYGVTTMIPKGFSILPEHIAKVKYPVEARPQYMYSDPAFDTSLGFNYTAQPLKDDQVPEMKDAMIDMIKSVQPSADWISNGVIDVHGQSVGYLSFVGPGLGGRIYTFMYFTALRDQLLLCNFNCNEKERRIWKPLAYGMMENLQILES
ncbi:hypothetical protein [Paenibacillus durus]|uniref:Uncharacterized protein n=1 Tax=Paenibacillus durus ATCC 35681 TaxID=1333534 RepID=A0A0F7FC84_PAEDU|nr:hypothetical protein [Paenibacillus durus]AKG36443.1 hypothetical protein VK70_19405 [Paenibacillus durus ATCC 35681]